MALSFLVVSLISLLQIFGITDAQKMIAVNGAPDLLTSYPLGSDEGYTWSECVGRCHMSPICIAAYGNSSNYCLMYSQGDILRVRNDWRGLTAAREKVAFKVTALTDECTDEASGMFEVETKWDSESMISYRVLTASDYYTIQYTHTATDVCGNWLDSDPNEHCLTCQQTMYRFRGTINAISQTSPITVNSWSGCLVACMLDINCFMIKYTSGLDCQLYKYGYVYSFIKIDDFTLSTPAEDLPFLGLKYPTDSSTCAVDLATLFGDYTFAIKPDQGIEAAFSSFRLRSDGATTTIDWIN